MIDSALLYIFRQEAAIRMIRPELGLVGPPEA